MNFSACFCGHRNISLYDEETILNIRKKVTELYENYNIVNYLSGGMGNFDTICENAILQLRKIHTDIKLFLVIPYQTFGLNENTEILTQRYDEIIYPNFEIEYHYKRIIMERNKWLIDNSDYIITKINHNYGGAFTTLNYAKKNHKKIVSI